MSSPADTPQTPPGLPPGTAPTQGPYTTSGMVPGPLPGTELDPGLHDVSAWSFWSSADDERAPPAIVSAARDLVLRYRRASWLAEAIRSDAARRVALRALREVRDALAPGITADGVKAAASMVEAVTNLDPATDTPVDIAGVAVAGASAALAVSAAAARRALAAATEWPDDVVTATLPAPVPAAAPPAAPAAPDTQGMLNAAASAAAAAAATAAPAATDAADVPKLPAGRASPHCRRPSML